jgi:aryl-alcohol dehydrogenase-like predicted oxidoreductase
MEMRNLGRTGVRVSELCLGAMSFGSMGNTDRDDCVSIVHRALDAGINFIDTADVSTRFTRLRRGAWTVESPGAQRKLALLPQLAGVAAEAGIDLIVLSLAFTLAHPAVTSTIIGPRPMEQLESQLRVAGMRLGDDVLDRIDALVALGDTIARADVAYEPRAIRHSRRRRLTAAA